MVEAAPSKRKLENRIDEMLASRGDWLPVKCFERLGNRTLMHGVGTKTKNA